MSEIQLTIDDRRIQADPGETLLEAAQHADIYIPNLCYDSDMEPAGACRMCVVEVEGQDDLVTACTTPVEEGMTVRTETDRLHRVRRMNCQLLLSDHPTDCLSCSSNQNCTLQDIAAYLGIEQRRLDPIERETRVDESNPFFRLDEEKCILCGRCVRACDEVRSVGAIQITERGLESKVGTFLDLPLTESVCETCGECIARCPTGALEPKRETEPPTDITRTICPYCGCGCGLEVGTRRGRMVSTRGDREHVVSKGSLCVKGRFGLEFVHSPDRLTAPLFGIDPDGNDLPERITTPMVRDGEGFRETSWEEALTVTARELGKIRDQHGADALAGLSSAKCTNEENYLFQKFMRAVIGTNNVDHCARLCHSSTVTGLAAAFGSGAMTNSIDELEKADCILVTGSNTTEAHPIIALRIKDAVRKHGADLVVADPRHIGLVDFADVHLQQQCGTDVALFNAFMNVIIEEDLVDSDYIEKRTEGYEAVRDTVAEYTPERAAAITGVPAEDIRSAARLYGGAKAGSIVYSMGITQHTTGTDNVLTLANLAMMTGNVGRESTGVNPLRGQNNVQGACDLGALPNVYPGYQNVDDPEIKQKFEEAWGTELDDSEGLTVVEMMEAAREGEVTGMYIMGENPMLSDPNVNTVAQSLDSLDFLVVQDIFMSETAERADVILPAASFAERDGTYTSTERRIQRLRAALPPLEGVRADWKILCNLAERMGYGMDYDHPAQIQDEIASVTPIYGGIHYDRLGNDGLQWPCTDRDDPGTKFLHEGEFAHGKGQFHAVEFREAAELPDEQYPYLFTTGRVLHHFHTGTLTRRVEGMEELSPPAIFEINPRDAEREDIEEGDMVEVSSRRGSVTAAAILTERSPEGTIFMPFHFHEAAANVLTNDALDPVAKIPEYKVCAANVENVADG
ncbi:MAG: formate dehydrogenase subunit alpha [Planctomycetota bacterium]